MSVHVERSPKLGIQVVSYRVMDHDPRGPFAIPIELSSMQSGGLGLAGPLRQLNVSVSNNLGTARGIHVSNTGKYCFAPLPGKGFHNVVVDLTHPDSPTYGQSEAFRLGVGRALYVPAGYGNALQSMQDGAVYLYLLDGDFQPEAERVVSLLDPTINLEWPLPAVNMSAKDQDGMSFEDYTRERRRLVSA